MLTLLRSRGTRRGVQCSAPLLLEEEFERDLQHLHGDPVSPMEDVGEQPYATG